MNKKQKEKIDNMFYSPALEFQQDIERESRKKVKEREKRIKENKKIKEKQDQFDLEIETVIGMTNRNNKKRNEVEKKVQNIKMQKRARKIKRIKRIAKYVTLIAIIAGGITFALVSPIFNIKIIEVKNNNQVSSETIISLSELNQGQNIFKIIPTKVEEKIKENAYMERANIKRILPNKIEIKIEEREKKFSLEFLNGYAYINSQGYILEISSDKLNLPVIQGATTPEEKIVAGNRLETQDLERLEVAIQIMEICKNNNLDSKVTSIDISNKSQYSIYMESEQKTIYLGDATKLSDRILWITPILDDNKGKAGEIFIDGDMSKNFNPRFREKVAI